MTKETSRKNRKTPRDGRPRKGVVLEKKRTPVQIVCEADLKTAFSRKCDEENINASEFIRERAIIPFVCGDSVVHDELTFRLTQVARLILDGPVRDREALIELLNRQSTLHVDSLILDAVKGQKEG